MLRFLSSIHLYPGTSEGSSHDIRPVMTEKLVLRYNSLDTRGIDDTNAVKMYTYAMFVYWGRLIAAEIHVVLPKHHMAVENRMIRTFAIPILAHLSKKSLVGLE